MGVGYQDLELLIRLREQELLPTTGSVAEIGAQQLGNSAIEAGAELEKLRLLFGVGSALRLAMQPTHIVHGTIEHLSPAAPMARELWTWLGWSYSAIDIDGSPGCIPLDLNFDRVPRNARGKFHLVTNFGTTEHVANQLNAFKIIHELTALNGIMVHHLPASGMINHGLFNYNPKFFWMLSRSSGYKWLYADFGLGHPYELPSNVVEHVKTFRPDIAERAQGYQISDGSVIVALQKIYDIPFVPPIDAPTGVAAANATLRRRYWTVYTPGAFDPPMRGSSFDRLVAWTRRSAVLAAAIRHSTKLLRGIVKPRQRTD